ncbi:DnaJ sub C member 3, partial [Nowakowskiella sp. JEL0078]
MRLGTLLLFYGLASCMPPSFAQKNDKPLNMWLTEAKEFQQNRKYAEALNAYEGAIERDPSVYSTYYKRALLYITIGKTQNAITDLSKTLDLNSALDPALLQRGKLYAKECQLNLALSDLNSYIQRKNDEEARQLVDEIDEVAKITESLTSDDCSIESLSKILNICTLSVNYRLQRARCFETVHDDIEMSIGDYRRASKLNLSPDLLYTISNLHLKLGEPSETINTVKECLKLDPEHSLCKKLFRKTKKLEKEFVKLEEAVANAKFATALKVLGIKDGKMVKDEGGLLQEVEEIKSKKLLGKMLSTTCRIFGELKKKEAIFWCSKSLEIDSDNVDSLYYRAEAKLDAEEYDEAIRDFQKAHDLDQQNQRVIAGFQRAQRLQKQAGARDYYKVLEVPRSASKRDIKKSYRKLAQQWHPDKYSGDLDKEAVIKKMSEINEAYGILSDDELRQRFDNGDDPN